MIRLSPQGLVADILANRAITLTNDREGRVILLRGASVLYLPGGWVSTGKREK